MNDRPKMRYEYNGEMLSVKELAKIAGCTESTMRSRIRYGMSPDDAVEMPIGGRQNKADTPPPDLLEKVVLLTRSQMMDHYGASSSMIERWLDVLWADPEKRQKMSEDIFCRYNIGVECKHGAEADDPACKKCGWNPNAPKRKVRYVKKPKPERDKS